MKIPMLHNVQNIKKVGRKLKTSVKSRNFHQRERWFKFTYLFVSRSNKGSINPDPFNLPISVVSRCNVISLFNYVRHMFEYFLM